MNDVKDMGRAQHVPADSHQRKMGVARVILGALIILLLIGEGTPSQAGLDVHKETWENGLNLLVVERKSLPLVIVTVGIRAGSLVELAEKAGMANLTAELLTEGTSGRTGVQISEEIEFVGGSLGASGSYDYVTVSLLILKKDISLGFSLLSDIILNPVFPMEELDKRRDRIKAGLKAAEDDPGYLASKIFLREIYGDQPYGRPVQGSADTLDIITRDDLVAFHRNLYVPNNSVMSVVGDITVSEVRSLLTEHFAGWQARGVQLNEPVFTDVRMKRQTVTINRDLAQANIIMGHAGLRRDNADYYAASVMNYILGGGGFASRLMQSVREEKGLVYDIHSSLDAQKEGGSFSISLQTKNASANNVIEEILQEMRKMRNTPVLDEELADAKAFLTGVFPVRIETSERIASFLVATEMYGLGTGYMDDYPIYINSVTKGDILRVAEEYLHPEAYVLVVVADQEEVSLQEEFMSGM